MPDNLPSCNAPARGREYDDRAFDNCMHCWEPMDEQECAATPIDGVCILCVEAHYRQCECKIYGRVGEHCDGCGKEVPDE